MENTKEKLCAELFASLGSCCSPRIPLPVLGRERTRNEIQISSSFFRARKTSIAPLIFFCYASCDTLLIRLPVTEPTEEPSTDITAGANAARGKNGNAGSENPLRHSTANRFR